VRVEFGEVAERLAIVRLDPTTVRFRVHYDPFAPRPVSAWAQHLQSFLVINGGYFTPENETTGLLISDGQVWGTPYGEFAGMFAVRSDGQVSVRWLRDQPYDPNEPVTEALQSFPVLVKPGGVMGFPADADDGRPARRTIVAQDREGRILIIVAPRGYLSLHGLAHFLADSDLDLDVALNLDGGFSTGLWLKVDGATTEPVRIDSLAPVPSVISADYR
jgi:exopolysaccharide biosynthesis protein